MPRRSPERFADVPLEMSILHDFRRLIFRRRPGEGLEIFLAQMPLGSEENTISIKVEEQHVKLLQTILEAK